MGWWLQFVGLILLFIGGGFSLVGFMISPQETVVQSLRNFFSQTQSIKVLPPSLGGNDSLSLDNVAILRLHVPYSLTSVTLLLDVVPTSLPDQHNAALIVEGAQYYNQLSGKEYVFNTTNNKRYEIAVAGRVFIVTLLKVVKLNVENVPQALEYQFGISEK